MTYIIAEVGGNHDGELSKALDLVGFAKEAGCDAVKFQTYSAPKLVHPDAPALAQAKGYTRQIERFADLEFAPGDWSRIIAECQMQEIDFLTTCFDLEALDEFAPAMPYIKVASGDLTYVDLLSAAASYGKPVLLSTGMATLDDIERAAQWVPRDLLIPMHCVSCYPTEDEDANLGMLEWMGETYPRFGYSDHTRGNLACIAATAMGAEVIEKHFTTTPDSDIGDHCLSADPGQMYELVQQVRRLDAMMGYAKPAACEMGARQTMRRGGYAARDMEKDEYIARADVLAIRPATRYAPHEYVGRRLRRAIKKGEPLDG